MKLNEENQKEIIRLYTVEKVGIKEIAKKFNVAYPSILNRLNRDGIRTAKARKINVDDIPKIISLYQDKNLSPKKIGQMFGVSNTTVGQCLRDAGCRIKTVSEGKRVYRVNESFFEKIDTENKAYWLGFLYADGCVIKNKRMYLNLTLAKKDKLHLEKFKSAIECQSPLYEIAPKSRTYKGVLIRGSGAFSLHVNSKKIVEDLIKLGCVPKKSLILEFPNEEQVPNCLIHHFIRGYFDGDGTIVKYNRGKRWEFRIKFLGTFKLLNVIGDIIKKQINIQKTKISIENKTRIYALNYGGNGNMMKTFRWIYSESTVFLQRKFDIFKDMEKQGVFHVSPTESHYRAKEYEFWSPTGECIKIKNLKLFCRNNPLLKQSGMLAVANGRERQYKGWTKYSKDKDWKKVKLMIPPTTGRNYNFQDLL